MLFRNSMYSAEQEEFWSLLNEHLLLEGEKHQVSALYDFDFIMRRRDCFARLDSFRRRHAGKSFRVFRVEDVEKLIRDDLEAYDDVLPIGVVNARLA